MPTIAGFSTASVLAAGGLAAGVGGIISSAVSAPGVPKVPAVPPSANPATLANAATSGAFINSKAKAAGAIGQGFDNTIATSPLGTSAPNTAKGTLLG